MADLDITRQQLSGIIHGLSPQYQYRRTCNPLKRWAQQILTLDKYTKFNQSKHTCDPYLHTHACTHAARMHTHTHTSLSSSMHGFVKGITHETQFSNSQTFHTLAFFLIQNVSFKKFWNIILSDLWPSWLKCLATLSSFLRRGGGGY